MLVNNVEAADEKITINKEIVKEYVDALRSVKEEYSLNDGLSLSDILRIPDAFTVVKTETDEEQLWADVKSAAEEALEHFIAMREAEGERMKRDVMSRLDKIPKVGRRSRNALPADGGGLPQAVLRQDVRGAEHHEHR